MKPTAPYSPPRMPGARAGPRQRRPAGPGGGLNASVAPAAMKHPGASPDRRNRPPSPLAVLDRAANRGIGFSAALTSAPASTSISPTCARLVSADAGQEALLVQFDAVASRRKFVSTARAVAPLKPVVAIPWHHPATLRGRQAIPCRRRPEAALRHAGWCASTPHRRPLRCCRGDGAQATDRGRPPGNSQRPWPGPRRRGSAAIVAANWRRWAKRGKALEKAGRHACRFRTDAAAAGHRSPTSG